MNVKEYYSHLFASANQIKEDSFSLDDDTFHKFTAASSFLSDITSFYQLIHDREEAIIFKNAIRVYQESILCLLSGLYQPAFMGLRYFLERMMAVVHFSTNQLELRTWLRGDRDTYWNSIIGADGDNSGQSSGIFSAKFVKAYFEELIEVSPQMMTLTKRVYRDCSEFVHGNKYAIDDLPTSLSFSLDLFTKWCEHAITVKHCVLYVLCVRYLKSFDKDSISTISSIIKEEFGTINDIKCLIDSYE